MTKRKHERVDTATGWLAITACLAALLIAPDRTRADEGGGDIGGGDQTALEFVAAGRAIVGMFERDESLRQSFPRVDPAALRQIIDEAKVRSEESVFVGGNNVSAGNDPVTKQIIVSRSRWPRQIGLGVGQFSLVLHEYLSLLRIETDRDYPISSRFSVWLATHPLPPVDAPPAQPARGLPDCGNGVGGKWEIGQLPYGCDLSDVLPVDRVLEAYGDHFYYDSAAGDGETRRYMSRMYSTVSELAGDYLRERRVGPVSATELREWRRFVFAVLQKESYWSHYRLAEDGRPKYVRGDAGHAYGILQIDLRSHALEAQLDLVPYLWRGLDLLYAHWSDAATAACVPKTKSWRERARSAYSIFNAGPGQACRWVHTTSTWHLNDLQFAVTYDAQAWLHWVTDPEAASTLDLDCLRLQGVAGCTHPRRGSR